MILQQQAIDHMKGNSIFYLSLSLLSVLKPVSFVVYQTHMKSSEHLSY